MKNKTPRLLFLFVVYILAACQVPTDSRSGQPYVPYLTDQVILDISRVLNDGAEVSWKLEPGKYKVEMTANNDGATAEWIGGDCPKTQQMRELTMTCDMRRTGQLVITNPTVFGLGKQVTITMKVIKLAR